MLKESSALFSCRFFIKQLQLICLLLLFSFSAVAQYSVTISLKNIPAVHGGDTFFIAGNFNEWDPGNIDFKFIKKAAVYQLELKNISAGDCKFKFTRGSWNKVECSADGHGIENRIIRINSDTSLVFEVLGWLDDFVTAPKIHTASENVHILDTSFEMPQLKKHRRIWIYLPSQYNKNRKHYPVLYMHDGQNIFDAYTSPFGEWGVDECLDSLIEQGAPPCIVVGIDNGGESRMNEYNPYQFIWNDSVNSKTFLPQGNEYAAFLVNTLKPFIDRHYRTLTLKENTIIAGSSMGGLISYYASLKYPDVFGKAGIFSPAFWTADGIESATDSLAARLNGKFFFYMGGNEGEHYLNDMIVLQEKMAKKSSAIIYSFIDTEAKHNEAAWRKWFPEFYKWIMAAGFNVITGGDN